MPNTSPPSFTSWSSFPFEGDLRVKKLDDPVPVEPTRKGEDPADCAKCQSPDEAYIWVNENWRVRSMDRPSGLPMVLILESRSHLDLGDLPNMLAAELGVMSVRLERAIRSLDGVARVHVNRWGDGAAHLHLWFLARPYGRLQLRGTFLTLWDEILPPISEEQWRENLALVAAWLAEFGGEPLAKPPRIDWKAPASLDAAAELGSTGGVAQADADQAEDDSADVAVAGADTAAAPAGIRQAGATEDAPAADPADATEAGGEPAAAVEPEADAAVAEPAAESATTEPAATEPAAGESVATEPAATPATAATEPESEDGSEPAAAATSEAAEDAGASTKDGAPAST